MRSDRDKLLFTPGPLTTSATVKQAALRDFGSRDGDFIAVVQELRTRLTELAEADPEDYTTVPMQGSGTFGIEACVGSVIPPDGHLLVAVNGAYGKRMVQIAERLGIDTTALTQPENSPVDPDGVKDVLDSDTSITHVAACHVETTSGVLNPVEEIGALISGAGKQFIVDAMSGFGGIPINMPAAKIDYLIASANKCIEGIPGFSYVIAQRSKLVACRDYARSISLDLVAQYDGLESNGQFRFTPPTHTVLAFAQALEELRAEGGVPGRYARYQNNHASLVAGMNELGFDCYVPVEHQSPIITSFVYPEFAAWDFEDFYARLSSRGFAIYPGKVSDADCFRIGTIGRIGEAEIGSLLEAIGQTLEDMGLPVPLAEREKPVALDSDCTVQAVIADLAGTTIDYGSCAPAGVFVSLFESNDVPITQEQAREPMGLHKRDHIAELLAMPPVAASWGSVYGSAPTDADIDRLYGDFIPLQIETLPNFGDLIPGVVDAVATLNGIGVGVGVTTGYDREMLEIVVACAKAGGFEPGAAFCASDVTRGRPAPWMLYRAMEALEAQHAYRVVAIGDTLPDVQAGVNAGCWAIGVTRTGNMLGLSKPDADALDATTLETRLDEAADLMRGAGAHYVIESFAEIVPVIEAINQRLARGERP